MHSSVLKQTFIYPYLYTTNMQREYKMSKKTAYKLMNTVQFTELNEVCSTCQTYKLRMSEYGGFCPHCDARKIAELAMQ